tara:strand:+ start:155 stop:295 length:141 start_codon:yes stop_codon:yes gene_type:complete
MADEQENKTLGEELPSKKVQENINSINSKQRQRPSFWDLLDVLWWI